MAILHTTVNQFARGHTVLELTPNPPAPRERVDTYTVRLHVHDHVVYDRIQSVRDWQMRHQYVEDIAQACCCVEQLLGQELACYSEAGTYFPLCTHMSTDWLTLTISAVHTKRFGDVVQVYVSVQQAEHNVGDTYYRSRGKWGQWQELTSAVILCTPADTIAFGRQLLEEIHAVEAMRVALGIPGYDNPAYNDFDEDG